MCITKITRRVGMSLLTGLGAVVAALSLAVSLANVVRLPTMVFLHGGGVNYVCCETETDVMVEELGNYLVDLDKKILRLLILPESSKGDTLLKMLEKFWKNFRYLDGLVVLNEQKAYRPAKFVLEKECPTFVQEAFDVLNLQKTYNWRSREFGTFKEYLIIIAGLSQKFQTDFSKMQIDVDTLFEKPYNNDENI